MNADREWVKVGAEVVLLDDAATNYVETTIKRIGKRDIVLASEHRVNVKSLREPDHNAWHFGAELVSATDPRVTVAKHNQRLILSKRRARAAVDAWLRGDGSGVEALNAVQVAISIETDTPWVEEGSNNFRKTPTTRSTR